MNGVHNLLAAAQADKEDKGLFLRRLIVLSLLFALGMIVLGGRLYTEQIRNGPGHNAEALTQAVRTIRLPAHRGRIYSSDGTVLAGNVPTYQIVFHLSSMLKRRRSQTLDYVLTCMQSVGMRIKRPVTVTREQIERQMNMYPAMPIVAFDQLSPAEAACAYEIPNPPPGMEIVVTPQRRYALNSTAAHIVGFVGREDPYSASDRRAFSYYQSDLTGREGLERTLDSQIIINNQTFDGLHGAPGYEMVLVNSRGYPQDMLEEPVAARAGNSVVLTLDINAQTLAERLFFYYRGAFVLMDVQTGDVLALVSTPSYDLNRCVPRLSSRQYKRWLDDPDRPLRSRATQEQNMPGSIIKPLTALASLKKYSSAETETCEGAVPIGNASIHCTGVHGELDIVRALKVSCNCFFIQRGLALGLERLQKVYEAMRLGQTPPHFPLRCAKGIVPSRDLNYRLHNRQWTPYDTALVSFGQGMIAVTPLQVVCYMSALANNGVGYEPNLIDRILAPDGSVLIRHTPEPYIHYEADAYTFSVIRQGMREVTETGGSGWRAQTDQAELFGKTGTAEVGLGTANSPRRKNTWFAGYAKHKDGRTYAFCSLIEDGYSGGRTNAPLIADFFNAWKKGAPPVDVPQREADEDVEEDENTLQL